MDKIKETFTSLCAKSMRDCNYDCANCKDANKVLAQIQALIVKEKAEIFKEIERTMKEGIYDTPAGKVIKFSASLVGWQALKKGGE